MSQNVVVPSFEFSSFYYPELLDALMQYKRINVPELSDESEFEPLIQLIRAYALVGHLNNVNIDIVANESTLPTAQLPETVRNMLRLIDYELEPSRPAQVDLVYELSKVFLLATEVVPIGSQAATERQGDNGPVFFEATESLSVTPTDVLTACKAAINVVPVGLTIFDKTTEANAPSTSWSPFVAAEVGEWVAFMHDSVMFNQVSVVVTTPAEGITGVWEFYDGDFAKGNPDSVVDLGTEITFDVNSVLGDENRSGTVVRVTYNDTGVSEDVTSYWTGGVNRVITSLLGQVVPSEINTSYTVGSDWTELGVDDETNGLSQSGAVSYPLPQTLDQCWQKTTIDDATGYAVRYRVVNTDVVVNPVLENIRIDEGKQYVSTLATQGRTAADNPLASSTGLASQTHSTSRRNFIPGSMVLTVDAAAWTQVDNFIFSEPQDEHYIVKLSDNNVASVSFGDGLTGKIPPVGIGNIASSYRFGAQDNGNVGAQSVTVDKSGLSFVSSVYNPRPGGGWSAGGAANAASLERAKVLGPLSLRAKTVAISSSDLLFFTQRYTDDTGAQPFSRAAAFEEGFGPKTVELVVVLKGGQPASQDQLTDLEVYFNGDKFSSPPQDAHFIANQEVIAVNYEPKSVNVTVDVYATDLTAAQVYSALQNLLQPESLEDDGISYTWDFGTLVPISRINHEIFSVSESIIKVSIADPPADIPLGKRELPLAGALTVNILPPSAIVIGE